MKMRLGDYKYWADCGAHKQWGNDTAGTILSVSPVWSPRDAATWNGAATLLLQPVWPGSIAVMIWCTAAPALLVSIRCECGVGWLGCWHDERVQLWPKSVVQQRDEKNLRLRDSHTRQTLSQKITNSLSVPWPSHIVFWERCFVQNQTMFTSRVLHLAWSLT